MRISTTLLSFFLATSVAHADLLNNRVLRGQRVCGDGVVQKGETCDGTTFGDGMSTNCEDYGCSGGYVSCTMDCYAIDTSTCENCGHALHHECGNGILEGIEECDGWSFGAATCEDAGCLEGRPTCSDTCKIDYSSCTGCSVYDDNSSALDTVVVDGSINQGDVLLAEMEPDTLSGGGSIIAARTTMAVNWLKDQNQARGGKKMALPAESTGDLAGVCLVYHQAVAVFAFLAVGDTASAERVLNNLQTWQQADGSFVHSYVCRTGEVHDYKEWVGNALWVALAALQYQQVTGDDSKRPMGLAAIDWSLQFQHTTGDGGFRLGKNPDGTSIDYASVESNQVALAALRGYGGYEQNTMYVLHFLMDYGWNSAEDRFNVGLDDTWNALDVNPWGVMVLGAGYTSALQYVEKNHKSEGDVCNGITGYDFDATLSISPNPFCDYSGTVNDVWYEGSALMSAAYHSLGFSETADNILKEIIKAQNSETGAVPFSCKGSCNQLSVMSTSDSVSATAWFVVAAQRVNPFDV